MDWDLLERLGWQKKVFVSNGSETYYYLTPSKDGSRRKIKNASDLNEQENHLVSTLFPTSKRKDHEDREQDCQPSTSKSRSISQNEAEASDPKQKMKTGLSVAAAESLIKNTQRNTDLKQPISETIIKLENICSSTIDYSIDVSKTIADLILAFDKDDNPFTEFPWDVSENIFSKIIDFGLKYTPDLLRKVSIIKNYLFSY